MPLPNHPQRTQAKRRNPKKAPPLQPKKKIPETKRRRASVTVSTATLPPNGQQLNTLNTVNRSQKRFCESSQSWSTSSIVPSHLVTVNFPRFLNNPACYPFLKAHCDLVQSWILAKNLFCSSTTSNSSELWPRIPAQLSVCCR